ncbi:MAG: dihydrolipoyl dehydrogenase [Pseudomonadota bacterium]
MVMGSLRQATGVVVIGAGPGGYVAAIRAADLGLEVTLVEEKPRLGGTCLLEGCIPSKALISAVELKEAATHAQNIGLSFEGMKVDLDKLRSFTAGVVDGLSTGVSGLLERRGVQVLHARARFDGPNSLALEGGELSGIDFEHAIIATGSSIHELPAAYGSPVWSSAEALTLPRVPSSLLVVGGGYIGLEMGLVYAGLGSQVSVVEFFPRLLMGADSDLVDVMLRQVQKRLHRILVDSKVIGVEYRQDHFEVQIEHEGERSVENFDQVLVAIGRKPNTAGLGLQALGIVVDDKGFVETDELCRTALPHIFAIGDITHGPMLAHKASREGKVAAEVIAGHPAAFDNRAVPAVVFTDPEIAWTGLTEREAQEQGQPVTIGRFPLSALGRARTLGRVDGMCKILVDPELKLILGMGIVGPHASELIAEGTLAIEMGATLEDLTMTIHPHPTLSEAILEAAEVAAGASVHVLPKKG